MSNILFNKNDYKVLEELIVRQCNIPVASLTIKQLMEITGMSLSKIRSVKNNFIMIGFIKEGSKDGNKKTYYITDKGIDHYKEVFDFDEEKIDKIIDEFENKNKGDEH